MRMVVKFGGTSIRTPVRMRSAALSNRAFIDSPGVIQAIADSLSRSGINIVEMVTSHANIVVYCTSEDGARAREILAARLGVRVQRTQPGSARSEQAAV